MKKIKFHSNLKQLVSLWIVLLMCLSASAQGKDFSKPLHIIPAPVSATRSQGRFVLSSHTQIVAKGQGASGVASFFSEMLNVSNGYHLREKKGDDHKDNTIFFLVNSTADALIGKEGYRLRVSPHKIVVMANTPHGLFYGIQTLMQLLPPAIEGHTAIKDTSWGIPCVSILDYPRFAWRGLMLDVSRHFFSKQFIKRYIDEMAKYKFNVFHWHLSDDQGWRIEIKGLPELTRIGAWRVPRTGRWHHLSPPMPGEKATYGGYYTQDDIREIVRYAQQRFVTIVPEIDVPAHSLALIAAFPNLSCTQQSYAVNPGSPLIKKETDNVLCVANDSTWLILDKIFSQVAQLFPGPYIHIGGDEAYKGFWENCPKDQALMRKENITDLKGLQSYFERKLEALISSKGKKAIGWDEVLEGGVDTGVTVMSWRGMKPGIEAARTGHPVIMTPILKTYLSRRQGSPLLEPVAPGMLRLKECYGFNPLPDSVNAKFILGGEGCLWTEFVPNERHAEYMTWPRALALSEVFWSSPDSHSWPDFIRRVEKQLPYFDRAGVKFANSIYDPIIKPFKDKNNTIKIHLSTEAPGLDIYYTFDGTNPDSYYPEYNGTPMDIPKGATEIRVIPYRKGKPVGRQINYPLVQ